LGKLVISINQLRDYQLFAGLNENELSILAPSLSKRTFARGAYLYYPGSPSLNIFLVESGLIRIFFTNLVGQEFLLDLVGPRSIVGIPLLREDQTRLGGASAVQPSTVLVLPQKDLNYFIQRSPHFMHTIYQEMDASLRKLLMYASSLATISLQGRIASALLYLTRDTGQGARNELELPISQTDFASWMGASRGALNRSLSRLQQLGLLRVEGQKFIILDRAGLQLLTEDMLLDQE
jgi:CRP/FNR family transcriptional regulator, anaerobic regulatory protein